MNDNHHREPILSVRRTVNLRGKRKKYRAREWHTGMYPFSTPSRIPRVLPRLIFSVWSRSVTCSGVEQFLKTKITSGKEREIEHFFSDF